MRGATGTAALLNRPGLMCRPCLGKDNIEIGLTLNMPAILRRTAERPP
jgi:hypothetical protein